MSALRQLIRTDGTVEDFPKPLSMDRIRSLIGARNTDTVSLRHLGRPLHVMVVDDEGYQTRMVDHGKGRFELMPVAALKPVNAKATELYHRNCQPGTTHQVVGDVFVVPDEDFA